MRLMRADLACLAPVSSLRLEPEMPRGRWFVHAERAVRCPLSLPPSSCEVALTHVEVRIYTKA